MKNLIKHLSVTLLLITGCKTSHRGFTPPQKTTDIVIDITPPKKINPLDRWFIPTTEETDPYPSVCSLHNKDGYLLGSAILIEKDVVLTAGHCIDEDNVFSISIGDEEIMVRETLLHPDYSISSFSVNNDIGLVFLECESSYEPAKIGCVEWMKRHQNITTVGYSYGYKKYSKRWVFTYFGTLIEDPNVFKFLPNITSIWFGDSGGGVFSKFEGDEYVIGIISSFTVMRLFENKQEVTECSATNIGKYIDWIEGSILYEQMEQLEKINEDGR